MSGLLLAGYLFFLSVLPWPCLGGGCDIVLRSEYGSLGPIPIALLGIVAWASLFFLPWILQKLILFLMVAAAAVLIYWQMVEIGSFCTWCNTHHLIAFLLLIHRRGPTLPISAVIALLALFPLLLWEQNRVAAKLPEASTAAATTESSPSGVPLLWESPSPDPPSLLVLSLDCPACLDKLDELYHLLQQQPDRQLRSTLHIYFLTDEENFPFQKKLLAALFPPQNEASFAENLQENWGLLRDDFPGPQLWSGLSPEEWSEILTFTFPHLPEGLEAWDQKLAEQQTFLRENQLQAAPLLGDQQGWTTHFLIDHLFK